MFEFLGDRDDLFVDELPNVGHDIGLEFGEAQRLSESGHDATLSKTAASPCPPPMHIVSNP